MLAVLQPFGPTSGPQQPAGPDELFRAIDGLAVFPEPDELERIAAPYGLNLDVDGTMAFLERHGLRL